MVQYDLKSYILYQLFIPVPLELKPIPDRFASISQYKESFRPFLLHETISSLLQRPIQTQIFSDEDGLFFDTEISKLKPNDVFLISKTQSFPHSMLQGFAIFIVEKVVPKNDSSENTKFCITFESHFAHDDIFDIGAAVIDIYYLGNITTNLRIEKSINNQDYAVFLQNYIGTRLPPTSKNGYLQSNSKVLELLSSLNRYSFFT
jgi:hypothetical protein